MSTISEPSRKTSSGESGPCASFKADARRPHRCGGCHCRQRDHQQGGGGGEGSGLNAEAAQSASSLLLRSPQLPPTSSHKVVLRSPSASDARLTSVVSADKESSGSSSPSQPARIKKKKKKRVHRFGSMGRQKRVSGSHGMLELEDAGGDQEGVPDHMLYLPNGRERSHTVSVMSDILEEEEGNEEEVEEGEGVPLSRDSISSFSLMPFSRRVMSSSRAISSPAAPKSPPSSPSKAPLPPHSGPDSPNSSSPSTTTGNSNIIPYGEASPALTIETPSTPKRSRRRRLPERRLSTVLSSPPGLFPAVLPAHSNPSSSTSPAISTSSELSPIALLTANIQRAAPNTVFADVFRQCLDILYERSSDIAPALASVLVPSRYRAHCGFLDRSSLDGLSLIATQITEFIRRHKVLRAVISMQAWWRGHKIRRIPRPLLSSLAQRNRTVAEILRLEIEHQTKLERFFNGFHLPHNTITRDFFGSEEEPLLGRNFPIFVAEHQRIVQRLTALIDKAAYDGLLISGVGRLYFDAVPSFFRVFYPNYARDSAQYDCLLQGFAADKKMSTILQQVKKDCGMSLSALLADIQRHVPRLTVHLQRFSSFDTLDPRDQSQALEATEAMMRVSTFIQKALSEAAPLASWLQIRRRIRIPEELSMLPSDRQLLDRKRLFIHEAIFPKISILHPSPLSLSLAGGLPVRKIVVKAVRCMLFQDALFCCSLESRSKGSLRLNAIIDLNHVTLILPAATEPSGKTAAASSVVEDAPSSNSNALLGKLPKPNQMMLVPSDGGSSTDSIKQIVRITALSPEDARPWTDLVRSAITGRRDSRLFGIPLKTILQRESSLVPNFIVFVATWILNNCASVIGLFRINPNSTVVHDIQSELEKNVASHQSFSFLSSHSPHDVAGVLKKFIYSLPTPLIPHHIYPALIELHKQHLGVSLALAEDIGVLLLNHANLPLENWRLMRYLAGFLNEYSRNSPQTQMTDSNLAIVLSPTVMYPPAHATSPDAQVAHVRIVNEIILTMIRWTDACFPPETERVPTDDA
ncbi:MAG: hypothetical protein Q8P67_08725 [archaeon]|nr:hypothetical protein [archaeon]